MLPSLIGMLTVQDEAADCDAALTVAIRQKAKPKSNNPTQTAIV
jgi:hypothetical protein